MSEFVYYVADQQPHTFGGTACLPAASTNFLSQILEAQGFRSATLAEYQTASDAAVNSFVAQPPQQEAGTTDEIAATVLRVPQEQPEIEDQLAQAEQPPADANT